MWTPAQRFVWLPAGWTITPALIAKKLALDAGGWVPYTQQAPPANTVPPPCLQFYRDVLGFTVVKRPSSFDFGGSCKLRGRAGSVPAPAALLTGGGAGRWLPSQLKHFLPRRTPPQAVSTTGPCRAGLFSYNVGIHLIEGQPVPRSSEIDPKSDHLSFQAGVGALGGVVLAPQSWWGRSLLARAAAQVGCARGLRILAMVACARQQVEGGGGFIHS